MLNKLRRLIAFFIDHWKLFFILGLACGGGLTTILVCSLVPGALAAILGITIGGAAIFAPLYLVSPGVAIAVLALATVVGILALGGLGWLTYKTVGLFDRFAHWVYGIIKPKEKADKNSDNIDLTLKDDNKMSCYQRISSALGSLIPCFCNDDEDEKNTKTQKKSTIVSRKIPSHTETGTSSSTHHSTTTSGSEDDEEDSDEDSGNVSQKSSKVGA